MQPAIIAAQTFIDACLQQFDPVTLGLNEHISNTLATTASVVSELEPIITSLNAATGDALDVITQRGYENIKRLETLHTTVQQAHGQISPSMFACLSIHPEDCVTRLMHLFDHIQDITWIAQRNEICFKLNSRAYNVYDSKTYVGGTYRVYLPPYNPSNPEAIAAYIKPPVNVVMFNSDYFHPNIPTEFSQLHVKLKTINYHLARLSFGPVFDELTYIFSRDINLTPSQITSLHYRHVTGAR